MRILLVVHRALPHSIGGVELWADALARGLHAHGSEVAMLALARRDDEPMFSLQTETAQWGTTFWLSHELSAARSFRDTWHDPRLEAPVREVLARFNPDVVHLAHPDGWGVWPLRSGRDHGAVTVATLHDYKWICGRGQMVRPPGQRCESIEEDRCTRCLRDQLGGGQGRSLLRHLAPRGLRERLRTADEQSDPSARGEPGLRVRRRWRSRQIALMASLRDADLVISPSRFVAERFQAAGLDRAVTVIPNGLDASERQPPRRPLSGPLRVGFFGNPHRTKGLDTLVRAVASRPAGSVQLRVYGATAIDLEEAGASGLSQHLMKAMGTYPAGSAVEHMEEVDVVAIPSTWDENHPLVAIEARLARKPLVVADRGGLPELVRDQLDGWVLPAADPAAWGERLGLLSANRSLLGQAVREIAPPASAYQMADDHLTAYEECGATRTANYATGGTRNSALAGPSR